MRELLQDVGAVSGRDAWVILDAFASEFTRGHELWPRRAPPLIPFEVLSRSAVMGAPAEAP
jgi:hypothetical protein